jgi:hypothetical protein
MKPWRWSAPNSVQESKRPASRYACVSSNPSFKLSIIAFQIDDGTSTLFLIDDGTSIIPIFEATQAAQVIPNMVNETVLCIAHQAQLNCSNARKAHQSYAITF